MSDQVKPGKRWPDVYRVFLPSFFFRRCPSGRLGMNERLANENETGRRRRRRRRRTCALSLSSNQSARSLSLFLFISLYFSLFLFISLSLSLFLRGRRFSFAKGHPPCFCLSIRVWPGLYRVLPSFTEFYRVLPSFTEFLVAVSTFLRVFTYFCWFHPCFI